MRISDWSSDVCSSDLTLEAVLSAVESANSARGWAPSVIRYELLLLAQLGFALDLSHCAGGGDAGDLAYVSPKSSIAVSRAMGAPYAERLLPLPGFLTGGDAAPGGEQIAEGFRLTGYFLTRDILTGKLADICATRERLTERLAGAGLAERKDT